MNLTHVSSLLGWAALPVDLADQFLGKSQMPIYEFDKKHVQRKGSRYRPYEYPRGFINDPKCLRAGEKPPQLEIGAWQLAHAIKKADCARRMPAFFLNVGAVGFLIEHLYQFDWNSENLRLANGMASVYADFAGTSLTGRVAQGMAILFMENRGYSFHDRFVPFLRGSAGHAKASRLLKTTGKKKGRRRTPDFVFETNQKVRALVESKGGFVGPGDSDPDIKGDLRDALLQLDGWGGRLSPKIPKSFAVGTYLREMEDLAEEPSLIAFVDPESPTAVDPIEYPSDAVRRGNYAAWLAGMGFRGPAIRLQSRMASPTLSEKSLLTISLGPRRYAFVPLGMRPNISRQELLDTLSHIETDEWYFGPPWLIRRGVVLTLMGIELSVLRCLSDVIRTGNTEALMSLERVSAPESPQQLGEGRFDGSVFADGTLVGELEISREARTRLKTENVAL